MRVCSASLTSGMLGLAWGGVTLQRRDGQSEADEFVVLFVQELGELMQWLADLGVDGPAFGRLRETLQSAESVTLRKQPSLAKATENLFSLREELYMTDSQVRPMRGRANAGYARSLHDQCGVEWLLDMCSGLPIAARCVSGRRWLA